MKKNQLLMFHFLFWIIYVIASVIIPIFVMKVKYPLLDISFFIVNFICFYINFFFVVPRFFDIKNLYKAILGFMISATCFVFIRYFVEEFLSPKFFGIRNYAEGTTFGYYFFDNIYFSSTIIFVSTVFGLFKFIAKTEQERIVLIEEKKKAEVQALKTQINPHFIFNSLNNIYALVYQKSDKALNALEELSKLLRYSTKDLEKDYIPLQREIGYIESLIALEKLRIQNPELIILDKNISNDQLLISPMLLVPFVENAFKHGDFLQCNLMIDFKVERETLYFCIENQKRKGSKDSLSGIGIGNVKKRLELIYPKRHQLEIVETEVKFRVNLKIILSND